MRFLIKFNNGLVDTTILMVGENEQEVVEAFKEDCNSNESFIKDNCFPECKFLGIDNLSKAEDKKMIRPPVLTKNKSHPYDYKEYTFKDFLIIQRKAQEVANKIGYPVYVVGSSLVKHNPRDIDLAIIIPHDEYVEKYKCRSKNDWDTSDVEHSGANFMTNAWYNEFENIEALEGLNFEGYKIDLKLCPDNWWTNKDKELLARPEIKEK